MRVLLNALPISGAKTGVGHYTAELIRCLREQAAPGEIHCFPRAWVHQARSLWGRVRPWIERETVPAPRPASGPAAKPPWRTGAVRYLRSKAQTLLREHLRSFLVKGRYD